MPRLAEQMLPLNFRLTDKCKDWPRLFAMTDAARSSDPLDLIDRLPVRSGLIFRHYEATNRAVLAREVVKKCRSRQIASFIAGDVKLALAVGADGVHLPQYLLARPLFGLRTFLMRGGRITAAVHSLSALRAAHQRGAGGIFISPVFATRSHPGKTPLGVHRFALLAKNRSEKVYALGGQKFETARRVLYAGAYGLAGIDLFETD